MVPPILFLLLTLVTTAQQQKLQCYIEGQCQGIAVDFSTTDSYNACLDRCKGNFNCNWITYYGDSGECVELYDCPFVDNDSCSECFSGEAECQPKEPVCNIAGICNGQLVTVNHTENVQSCLKFCQSTEGCNWYSYRLDSKDCLLTANCLLIDDTCTNCLSGERDCQLDNSGGVIGNKIFVASGDPANYTVEVVDLLDNSQSITSCSRLADYPGGAYAPVGTYLENNNTLIVCGGYSIATERCYNYQPQNDSWVKVYSMVEGRFYATAVMVSPTKWWVTGGQNGAILSSTEMFTVEEGFSRYVDLPIAVYAHNLVRVNETHYVLLGGGGSPGATNKAWFFNMDTETWTELPTLPVATSLAQAGLVTHTNGSAEIVVTAGAGSTATQIFSLESQRWRIGQKLPLGELEQGSSVPYGDTFLIVGGYLPIPFPTGQQQDTIFKYGVDSGEWEEMPKKLNLARDQTAAFLVPDEFITCDPWH